MFTPEIEKQLLNACQQRLRDVVLFVPDTGMRNGSEVVRMRWEYVNFTDCYYHNPKGKTEQPRRIVPLSDRVIQALQARNPPE
jgi:integrase